MDLRSIFIIFSAISITQTFPTICSENEWQCSDGTCIAKAARCDNFPDCSDGSDELKCTVSPVCLEGLESCPQPNGTNVCVKKAIGCGCGTVPDISNGDIVSTSNLIGSLANVTCDAGYQPSVLSVICQKTGIWETASCKPKDCGPISKIPFGMIRLADMSNTTLGAFGFVVCDVGYDTYTPNITCQKNGWTSAVCSLKDCGSPPDVLFGIITLHNDSISMVGATASVTCVDNYTQSKPRITCLTSGVWEQVSCNLSGCGKVPIISHGIIKPSGKTTFESIAKVECDVGYHASELNVSCQRTGDWEMAECLPIDCGSPPNILFGNITLHDNSISTVGAKASVTCVDNYTQSKPTITCMTSGVWDQVSCNLSGCGKVPKISHGMIKHSGKTTFGSFAKVECDVGYHARELNVSCRRTGDWEMAECLPLDCGSPPDILFGKSTLHNNSISTVGATAFVTCLDNFTPSKPTITCCASGVWEQVSCDLSGCGKVPMISHGIIKPSVKTTFGSFAKVECDVGYHANKLNVSCRRTGDWEMAECLPIDCGSPPDILFGNIILHNNSISTVGATASVTCVDKYTPSKPTITCAATGAWEEVSCDLSGCGDLPNIDHGILNPIGKSTFGSFAEVKCEVGYETKTSTISCQRSGHWEISTCILIDCGPLPTITNGKIIMNEANKTSYGATANVICDTGYATDVATISCLGNWQRAQCKIKDCGQVPDVPFAKVHLIGANNTTYGAIARVTCNNGFESNTPTVKCTSSGVWQTTTCKAKDCGPPPIIPNGRISIISHKTTYGSKALVKCHSKYASNVTYIECLTTGFWENARCSRQDQNNRDRCTEEHGVCTKYIYENVRLLALKSSKCRTFCQCIHAGTSVGGVITYKWAEHQCPARTLFDDNLISPVCNHQFLVSC